MKAEIENISRNGDEDFILKLTPETDEDRNRALELYSIIKLDNDGEISVRVTALSYGYMDPNICFCIKSDRDPITT